MKNNRTTALLMLLVFLLVVAVVIIFLTGLDRNTRTDNPYENVTVTAAPDLPEESAEPTPPPTTVPTTAPQYYPPSTATPVQTAAPVSTGAPASAATPAPTPSPTPVASLEDGGILPAQQLVPVVPGVNDNTGDGGDSPVTIPIGTVIGSGQFRSDTGTALNIHADWTASINDPQTANVTITVFADHYSLITTATPGALQVSVDGPSRRSVSTALAAFSVSPTPPRCRNPLCLAMTSSRSYPETNSSSVIFSRELSDSAEVSCSSSRSDDATASMSKTSSFIAPVYARL